MTNKKLDKIEQLVAANNLPLAVAYCIDEIETLGASVSRSANLSLVIPENYSLIDLIKNLVDLLRKNEAPTVGYLNAFLVGLQIEKNERQLYSLYEVMKRNKRLNPNSCRIVMRTASEGMNKNVVISAYSELSKMNLKWVENAKLFVGIARALIIVKAYGLLDQLLKESADTKLEESEYRFIFITCKEPDSLIYAKYFFEQACHHGHDCRENVNAYLDLLMFHGNFEEAGKIYAKYKSIYRINFSAAEIDLHGLSYASTYFVMLNYLSTLKSDKQLSLITGKTRPREFVYERVEENHHPISQAIKDVLTNHFPLGSLKLDPNNPGLWEVCFVPNVLNELKKVDLISEKIHLNCTRQNYSRANYLFVSFNANTNLITSEDCLLVTSSNHPAARLFLNSIIQAVVETSNTYEIKRLYPTLSSNLNVEHYLALYRAALLAKDSDLLAMIFPRLFQLSNRLTCIDVGLKLGLENNHKFLVATVLLTVIATTLENEKLIPLIQLACKHQNVEVATDLLRLTLGVVVLNQSSVEFLVKTAVENAEFDTVLYLLNKIANVTCIDPVIITPIFCDLVANNGRADIFEKLSQLKLIKPANFLAHLKLIIQNDRFDREVVSIYEKLKQHSIAIPAELMQSFVTFCSKFMTSQKMTSGETLFSSLFNDAKKICSFKSDEYLRFLFSAMNEENANLVDELLNRVKLLRVKFTPTEYDRLLVIASEKGSTMFYSVFNHLSRERHQISHGSMCSILVITTARDKNLYDDCMVLFNQIRQPAANHFAVMFHHPNSNADHSANSHAPIIRPGFYSSGD